MTGTLPAGLCGRHRQGTEPGLQAGCFSLISIIPFFAMNKRIAYLWKFLTYDIWRITEDEVTKTTYSVYNIIKTV